MGVLNIFKSEKNPTLVEKRFYKEDGIWYIDLPEFLEAKLGTKANLMMVAGADTLLDKLSNNGKEITIKFSDAEFPGCQRTLCYVSIGLDKEYLDSVGHASVDEGAYYIDKENNHKLWLCPVTRYVFGGYYPLTIYIQTIK